MKCVYNPKLQQVQKGKLIYVMFFARSYSPSANIFHSMTNFQPLRTVSMIYQDYVLAYIVCEKRSQFDGLTHRN